MRENHARPKQRKIPQSRNRFLDEDLLHDDATPFICCILPGTLALSVLRFGDEADGGEREKIYWLNIERPQHLYPSNGHWTVLEVGVINLTIIGLRWHLFFGPGRT
jgi:hypothetical protein